jgi:hypothetical protein
MPWPTKTYHITAGPHSYFARPSRIKGYRWELVVAGGKSLGAFTARWHLMAFVEKLHDRRFPAKATAMDDVDPDEPAEEEQNEDP